MSDVWMTVRVGRRAVEARDVISFDLVPTGQYALPAFAAGAHIDVEIAPGLIRQYSLCNSPYERSRYQIAVLHDQNSRGGSVAMHQHVAVGQLLRISAPRNHFALHSAAGHSILVAGGIGITPILSMAAELEMAGASFEIHYCARSQERCAFQRDMEAAAYAHRVHLYFNDSPERPRFDVGAMLAQGNPEAHVYVCGPSGFIDHVLGSARQHGFPEVQLHREFFAVQPPVATGADQAFEVNLARSGKVLVVPPDKSIAETLQAHGIPVALSCEQGVCGTCLTKLLAGQADHRDYFQTAAEQAANEQIAICCSRSLSPALVLDL